MNTQDSPSWTPGDLLRAFERRGYQRVELPDRCPPGSLRYESPTSSESARQYIQLNLKPRMNAYDVWAGFHNSNARAILNRFLDPIRQLSTAENNRFHGPQGPFWTAFNATRVLGGLHLIPQPTDRRMGPQQFAALVEKFLEPTFESTKTVSDIVDRLLSEEKPLEWFAGSRVARAADVLATAAVAKRPSSEVIPQLLERCESGSSLAARWPEVVSRLANLFDYQ